MKSSIVFFDSLENSKRGLFRTLVIFPIFIILTVVWLFFTKNIFYDKHIDSVSKTRVWVSMIATTILIISALGIQTADTLQQAVVFSALVGLVVYGFTNATLLAVSEKWDYLISFIDTAWGIFSTSLMGFILYFVVNKWPKIFASV